MSRLGWDGIYKGGEVCVKWGGSCIKYNYALNLEQLPGSMPSLLSMSPRIPPGGYAPGGESDVAYTVKAMKRSVVSTFDLFLSYNYY